MFFKAWQPKWHSISLRREPWNDGNRPSSVNSNIAWGNLTPGDVPIWGVPQNGRCLLWMTWGYCETSENPRFSLEITGTKMISTWSSHSRHGLSIGFPWITSWITCHQALLSLGAKLFSWSAGSVFCERPRVKDGGSRRFMATLMGHMMVS